MVKGYSEKQLINLTNRHKFEKLCRILCYPRDDFELCRRRLEELYKLGVRCIIPIGRARICGISILGKGCESIVIAGLMEMNGVIAIKIRRLDSSRRTMRGEATKLSIANRVGVGPKLIAFTDDFILMEYVNGIELPDFIRKVRDRNKLIRVLVDILEQTYKLDSVGLIHKELSRANRHILIRKYDLKPFILDFETASLTSKSSNLTQVISFLFIKPSTIRSKIYQLLGTVNADKLIEVLREYKRSRSRKDYTKLLKLLYLY